MSDMNEKEMDELIFSQKSQENGQENEPLQQRSGKSKKTRLSSLVEEEEVVPLWLITFTDAIALMLTFFVLLYAMSTPKQEQWEAMTMALNKEFGEYFSKKDFAGLQDSITIEKIETKSALSLSYLEALFESLATKDERVSGLIVNLQKDRLVLSLPSDVLFESGKAQVKEDGQRALYVLGDVLSRIRNRIEVIGHTDPRPVTGRYQSNWHLSLARATSVATILRSVGYDKNMVIRGLSDSRYRELPSDMDEEEKLDKARRVDIVILKNAGPKRTFFKLDEF